MMGGGEMMLDSELDLPWVSGGYVMKSRVQVGG